MSGGNGSLVQVEVTAGDVSVHPDFIGYYTLEVENGTWDVTASLTGYEPQTVYAVIVPENDTTFGVDFVLDTLQITGFVEGSVTLFNGTADITEVTVNAGTQAVHPDPDGNYILELPPGTYTVYASHPYTLTDSVTGIQVEEEMTITDVDFNLEVVYADLICKAYCLTAGFILNDVDVEVSGPDSTFSGYIENDSIIFHRLHYGTYNGEAWYYSYGPAYAETDLGENNHYMEFFILIGGLADGADQPEFGLTAIPNPFMDRTKICFNLEKKNVVTIRLFDLQSQLIATLQDGELIAGEHQIELSAFPSLPPLKPGMYYIVLESMGKTGFIKIIKR